MAAQWQRLRAWLQRVVGGEDAPSIDDVTRFAWLYRRHMDREAAAVLPFARESLCAGELAALGGRMVARRRT